MQANVQDEDYFSGAIFVADTNYYNQSNLKGCQSMELDAYIPDRYFLYSSKKAVLDRTWVLA